MLTYLENHVKEHIFQLFNQADLSNLFYHNYDHTAEVVNRINFLAEGQSNEYGSLLRIAGWFHDLGYLYNYHNHEDKGMLLAKEFLQEQEIGALHIQTIINCIEATKIPLQPRNKLEEIIKDADIGFGVTDNFFITGPQLRQEWEVQLNKHYTELEWEELQYNFIAGIKFYSPSAKRHYTPIVEQNIILQKKKLELFL
jgi:uncharacterized protein